MASCILKKQIVKVEQEAEFTLKLNKYEVAALVAVLGRVAGNSEHTPRKYTDEIYDTLQYKTVQDADSDFGLEGYMPPGSCISFKDKSLDRFNSEVDGIAKQLLQEEV